VTSSTDTIIGNIVAVLSAAPDLGIAHFGQDYLPEFPPQYMPGLAIVPRKVRETRQAGGQAAGSKHLRFDLECFLYSQGQVGDEDQPGIDHHNLSESILTRLRNAAWASLGVHEWAGNMAIDRLPPLRDNETIGLVSIITIEGMALYIDG
jgi:hypothetical protein